MSKHLVPPEMLAYLDGELSWLQRRKRKSHLSSCWACRVELEKLESDISVILKAQTEIFSPALPAPPAVWCSFEALIASAEPRSTCSPAYRLSQSRWAVLRTIRAPSAAALAFVVLLLTFILFETKPVSAREMLRNVQIADAQRESITKGQVIRQRVHVRRKSAAPISQNAGSSGLVDAWRSTTTTYWDASQGGPVLAELKAQYTAHNVPLNLPLSADSARDWLALVGDKPVVSKKGEEVTLSYASQSEPGTRVDLLIQSDTWKVQEMKLQFPDASFELIEDDFAILPVSAVPSTFVAMLEPEIERPSAETLRPVLTKARIAEKASKLDLNGTELEVLMTLHRLHADLGEPLTVSESPKDVAVDLWQLPVARQTEISSALQPIRGVRVVTAPASSVPVSGSVASPAVVYQRVPVHSPVTSAADEGTDDRLARFFGSPLREQNFSRIALAKSTTVLAHVYALHNLQVKFSDEREAALAPAEREELISMTRDHAVQALAALSDLQNYMSQLNTTFAVQENVPDPEPDVMGPTWQRESVDALTLARSSDAILRGFLTASETPITPSLALPKLQRDFSRLAANLLAVQQR